MQERDFMRKKTKVNSKTDIRLDVIISRLIELIKTMIHKPIIMIIIIAMIGIEGLLAYVLKLHLDKSKMLLVLRPISELSMSISLLVFVVMIFITIIVMSTPKHAYKHHKGFSEIGLYNRHGETPELIRSYKDNGLICHEYKSVGIPLTAYMDSLGKIEAALNVHVVSVEQGKSMQRIIIRVRPGTEMLPTHVMWSDEYLNEEDGVLSLGMCAGGFIKRVDVNNLAHILIGGMTGSGKSVLVKVLLYQCKVLGWIIYLFDFKGGVDYMIQERENYHLVSDLTKMKMNLLGILNTLKSREERLAETECPNIHAYNIKYPKHKMQRVAVVIDEAATVFSKKGASKEKKAIIDSIENAVEEIARKGRAVGIHLIVSTQRPDAEVIPGQIKSNLNTRIAGRSSDVLSKVILDNSKASEIPANLPGRFIDETGESFQGFDF